MRNASFMELMVTIDKSSTESLYAQIREQIRTAILRGYLSAGERLPSVKGLARSIGVSHVTIEKAYALLAAEGLVYSKPRSGHIVADLDRPFPARDDVELSADVRRAMHFRHRGETGYAHAHEDVMRYDFSYTSLEPDSFPLDAWMRMEREVMLGEGATGMTRYVDLSSASDLQKQVCDFLRKSRNVNCVPAQVIPVPGRTVALQTVLALFNPRVHSIAVPEPGLTNYVETAKNAGFRVIPIARRMDEEARGKDLPPSLIEQLEESKPDVVISSPSDRFPIGTALVRPTRKRLVKWADKQGAYVLEDDTGALFHLGKAPAPALQSLDAAGRVVYYTSFSNVLSPSLRIGFLVLPPELLREYNLKVNNPELVPWSNAATLAEFMRQGLIGQQILRQTKARALKRAKLMECLKDQMGDAVRIEGGHSGAYLLISVANGMDQDRLIASARSHDVAVYGTRHFWFAHPARRPQVLLGFTAIRLDDIPPAVVALKDAWIDEPSE